MKQQIENESIKSRAASAASMPKDVVLGASVITILGTGEMCIENYRGIIEYTDTMIQMCIRDR